MASTKIKAPTKRRPVMQIRKAFTKLFALLHNSTFLRGKNLIEEGERKLLMHIRFFLAGALPHDLTPEIRIDTDEGKGLIDYQIGTVATEFAVFRRKGLTYKNHCSELQKLCKHSESNKSGVYAIFDVSGKKRTKKELLTGFTKIIKENQYKIGKKFAVMYFFAEDGKFKNYSFWIKPHA